MTDRRGRWYAAAVAAAYLAGGWALTARLWADPAHRQPPNPPDVALFTWLLTWAAHPSASLHATQLGVPQGVNVMWQTAVLLPGLLLAPLTRATGAQVTYTLLLALGPSLSALSAYAVLRRLAIRPAAAALGGAIYGFSPAIVAEAYGGHLQFTLAVLPPVLLLVAGEALAGRRPVVRGGLLLGLLAGLQLLVGEELLLLTALAGVVVAAMLRPPWRRLGRLVLAALPTALLVAGWPLAVQFLGPARVHGNVQARGHFREDLLAYLVPSRLLLLRPLPEVAARFPTGVQEVTAYVGLLLLALCVVVAVRGWADRRVRVAAVLAAVFALLSLGPLLTVAGVRAPVPLPWALVEVLPVVGSALPTRLPLLTALAVGLLAAIAGQRWGRRGLLVAALAALPLLPRPLPAVPVPPVPAYFVAQPRGTLLVLPFPTPVETAPMRWQAAAGLSFAMPGGFYVAPSAKGHAQLGPPLRPTAALLAAVEADGRVPTVTPSDRAQFRRDAAYWGIDAVVLGPADHRAALRATVTALVGRPPMQRGGVELWAL